MVMSSLISKSEKVTPSEWLNGLLYGSPGVGKTHLLATAGSCEATSPALIITFDRKDATLSKFSGMDNLKVLDMCQVARSGNKTVTNTTETVVQDIEKGKAKQFRFIGVDGLSRLLNPIIHGEIVKEELALPGSKHDPELMEQRDYLRSTVRVYDWVERLRNASIDIGFHLIFCARERSDYLESPEYTGDFFFPDLSPELRRLILHEFDFLYRLVVAPITVKGKDGKPMRSSYRSLYTTLSSSMVVKDRFGEIPNRSKDVTMEVLWRYNIDLPRRKFKGEKIVVGSNNHTPPEATVIEDSKEVKIDS